MESFTLFGTLIHTQDSAINLTDLPEYDISSYEINSLEQDLHDELLDLEEFFFSSIYNSTVFKVSGNSMIEAGIFDGDLAIVDRERLAVTDDLVIVSIEGKYSLRYLRQTKKGIRILKAANKNYKTIRAEGKEIFGVVTSIVRKFI